VHSRPALFGHCLFPQCVSLRHASNTRSTCRFCARITPIWATHQDCKSFASMISATHDESLSALRRSLVTISAVHLNFKGRLLRLYFLFPSLVFVSGVGIGLVCGLMVLASHVAIAGDNRLGKCETSVTSARGANGRISFGLSPDRNEESCVTVRILTGNGSTYAGIAFRRPKCRHRHIWQPVERYEGMARKIIHDRLGRSGDCCDRRLALLYRASSLVPCELVSQVGRPTPDREHL
jgi:hypothetical protein